MAWNLIGAIICVFLGTVIAWISYCISKYMINNHPQGYAATTFIRQFLHIAFLVAVYFVGEALPLDVLYLLLGAAVGITASMIYFTKKLISINNSSKTNKGEADKNG